MLSIQSIGTFKFKYHINQSVFGHMIYSKSVKKRIQELSLEHEIDPLLALVEKIAHHDEDAMSELYDATVNRIYGLAIKIVIKPELAQEVVGDVFLQVWNKANDFDSKRAVPMAWMLMICRSRSLDLLRKEKKTDAYELQEYDQKQDVDNGELTPFKDIENLELSKRVKKALSMLTENQRLTICLAFYKDMSHQEISDFTGDPLGTVKTNIRRAQIILRETLCEEDLTGATIYE